MTKLIEDRAQNIGGNLPPRKGRLAPAPKTWEALGEDAGLRALLTDFYRRIYDDPDLSPFFSGIGLDWAVSKQFNFLRSILTGRRDYFGNHPRRAHYWMVISDDLFDYREDLFAETLRDHGLAEGHVEHLRSINEVFRSTIVKDRPLPRSRGQSSSERFEQARLDVGTLCDLCERELSAGEQVSYHLRTGKTYCLQCFDDRAETPADPASS